jgi:rhodanese-related sulfurtransferase
MTMNARVELPSAREVCPTTTRRLIGEGALLVDVRELAEVAQVAFDVPGVLLMPLSELEQRFAELPRDRDLVLVCQVGERSLKASYFLMYQGYTRVANMEGGILKWARKGFPIKGMQPAPTAAAGGCCGGAPATAQATAACCSGSAVGRDEPAVAGGCCSPKSGRSGSCC